jgi:hypothetical protein
MFGIAFRCVAFSSVQFIASWFDWDEKEIRLARSIRWVESGLARRSSSSRQRREMFLNMFFSKQKDTVCDVKMHFIFRLPILKVSPKHS